MALGQRISTYFDGAWHDGDVAILRAADHATWLGTLVFDGARTFDGVSPDLGLHCQRIIKSAKAMGMDACVSAEEIEGLAREQIAKYPNDLALYIRPMMWSTEGGPGIIAPDATSTRFALCIEDTPMPELGEIALGVSSFRRPRQDTALTQAKAACLYPNNGRILAEAQKNGFNNALSLDLEGNVAETASTNVFLVRGGQISTPKPNGTFLAGITRLRIIDLLRQDGFSVDEAVLSLDDFEEADEIFLTGNASKITPVTRYKDKELGLGKISLRARELYWDYAHSGT